MNNIHVIGNLTAKPELYESKDFDCCNFSVADNFNEDVIFHNVTAFNELANVCMQYLKKGHKVYVSGRLQETKKNDKIFRTIIANKIEFFTPKSENEENGTKKSYNKSSKGKK